MPSSGENYGTFPAVKRFVAVETRLIVAYALIAFMAAAFVSFCVIVVRRRRAHRRTMQGRGKYTKR